MIALSEILAAQTMRLQRSAAIHDRFTAIVNPPEAAILAVGRVRDRVVARDGGAVVAPVVTLTLSVDHRVVDGAPAAAFLADLAGRLETGSP